MRILALDVGEKNIGLAISDELGWTAQGLPSIKVQSRDKSIASILDITRQRQVGEIVVGMPVNLDGTTGKKAKEVADFVQDLKKRTQLPIKVWDERLTSMQAEKLMLEADLSRKKRKKRIDMLSAQLILQSYLDAESRSDNA
ncbi:MAG: Holliday junction resolvase RuvX [Candidatus Omnitrophota bacterium]|nr:MAG: Holliday junction resolvase RuvX [Candidatus Omnitrophota bacterium]